MLRLELPLQGFFLSKFLSPFINPLLTIQRAPILIVITVIFKFLSFFDSQARSMYLSFFIFFLKLYSVLSRTADSTILQLLLLFLIITSSGFLVGIMWWFLCQNPRGVCACHSPGMILGCKYTIYSYVQILVSCKIPRGSPCSPSRV